MARRSLGGASDVRGVAGTSNEPPSRSRPPAWLQERLFERRFVFITGPLDDAVAAQAAAEVMILDAAGDAPIEVFLNSPDGALAAAFVLMDTFDLLNATVSAHCRGEVGGPVIGVVAAADRRFASPHTRFRLGQSTAQLSGTADQIAAGSRQQQEMLWRLQARVARATGRAVEEIAEDMRQGRYLDARGALAYGLIDAITMGAP